MRRTGAMTQKLTERLQERLAQQSAEIEELTLSELRQLAKRLQRESELVLSSTQANIRATTEEVNASLTRLKRFGKWWWAALIVTWLMIGGLSVWHSTVPKTAGIELYQTFTFGDRTYLLLPEGTRAVTCTETGSARKIPCVQLPEGEK